MIRIQKILHLHLFEMKSSPFLYRTQRFDLFVGPARVCLDSAETRMAFPSTAGRDGDGGSVNLN